MSMMLWEVIARRLEMSSFLERGRKLRITNIEIVNFRRKNIEYYLRLQLQSYKNKVKHLSGIIPVSL